jgi:phosphoribosylformylglycinamidine cyclo-ligase
VAKGLSYRQTGVDIDVADADMLRTFNMGVGMALVVAPTAVDAIRTHLADRNCDSYVIGKITSGKKKVRYAGELNW